jgi:hypothetical protein
MPRKAPDPDPPPEPDLADRLEVVVDGDATPGDVLGALAELLIDLAERDEAQEGGGAASSQTGSG